MIAFERHEAPRTLEEAARLLAEGPATLLAGGTDLMPRSRAGLVDVEGTLVSLGRIDSMRGVSREPGSGRLSIGARTTVTEIKDDELLGRSVPILPRVADRFASSQIRNAATIGGNVVNASPAGDLIIPLLLLDADVDIARWTGQAVARRQVPLRHFFTGPGGTVLAGGEIVTAFSCDVPADGSLARFEKFGTRPALDISIVSIGVAANREGGLLRDVRVAFGAVAPTPLRGRATEAVLEGASPTADVIERAASAARQEISPIDDVRATAWYRRELVGTLIGRMLRNVDTDD